MTITKINLNEDNKLEFELSMQGANANTAKTRFCVVTEDREYVFNGTFSAGKVDFKLPILENVLSAGVYECRLEVIVDSHYFAPINDAIEFVSPVAVKEAKVVNVKEEEVVPSVSINSIKVTANPKSETTVTSKSIVTTMTESIKDQADRAQVQFSDGKMAIDTKLAEEVLQLRSKLSEDQKRKFNDLLLTKSGFIKLTKLLK